MNFIYPTKYEDLKDGDNIQKMYPMSNVWGNSFKFSSNICCTHKDNLKHLISKKRLRIVK